MSNPPKTSVKVEEVLQSIIGPVDVIGKAVFGDLWKTFYLSIQDAIALGLLLQVPSLIGNIIIGKDFSSFDLCMQENALGVNRYACFIIVTSNFCLWSVLAARLIVRFFQDFVVLFKKKKNVSNS